jgi:hypothetical protein
MTSDNCVRRSVTLGDLHPGLASQNTNCLHELDIFGFTDKADGVALGMAAETVIESLAIIDVKTGGFFLMKRAWRPHVTLTLIGLARVPHHFAPNHL